MAEKTSKKGGNKWLTTIGILLLVAGLILVFNKPIMGFVVNQMTDSTLQHKAGNNYDDSIAVAKESSDVTFDFEQVKDISLGEVLKAQMDSKKPDSIGMVSVPDVNMQLPILYGISNKNLAIGAGTMKEDMPMGTGNYALAGHNVRNERSLFSPLTLAKTGMKAYVTDYEKVYIYEIDKVYNVEATAVEVINDQPNKKELTLVTCSFNGSKRQITHAKFVRAINIDEAPKEAFHEEK
ncbi:class A sortase [Kurthia huakuii]|uniref:class A sortase n=1 Tax=Kurthia huakuii TaxID=1421019 RepID=UPI00049609C9|nr:class A sortase [Kurthia huakuii]MBM7700527.1 sortase A [Kurthia huakuii]